MDTLRPCPLQSAWGCRWDQLAWLFWRRHITASGPLGLTRDQLAAKLSKSHEQDHSASLHPALEALLHQGAVQWAPTFDENVLVSTALVDRLASNFQRSTAEDSPAASDSQSMAGLQAAEPEAPDNAAGPVDVPAQATQAHGGRAESQGLIRPWLDDKGKLNEPLWSALTRRIMSVVMRNPGEMPILAKTVKHTGDWFIRDV